MFELIYISAATCAFSEADLTALLAMARRRNAELGVSGMLLYHEGSFIQVLEGEREVVEGLFARIEEDPRHADARILSRREVEARSFGDWSMGFFSTAAVAGLEGFNDFLRRGSLIGDAVDCTTVRRVLLGFREGNWRAKVDG